MTILKQISIRDDRKFAKNILFFPIDFIISILTKFPGQIFEKNSKVLIFFGLNSVLKIIPQSGYKIVNYRYIGGGVRIGVRRIGCYYLWWWRFEIEDEIWIHFVVNESTVKLYKSFRWLFFSFEFCLKSNIGRLA